MRINSTWIEHHSEQVEAARAEFNALWPVEAQLLRHSGRSDEYIRQEEIANWIEFLEMRVPEQYPGDLP